MTEALRAELAALRELVAQLMTAVTTDREETAEAITRLEAAVTDLLGRPGDPQSVAGGAGDAEEEPTAWVEVATAEEWVDLADWVDWLIRTYDLSTERRIYPCWPAHLGLAEELAALHSAWREAADRARGVDSDALAFWHDRYLAPFLARMNAIYGTRGCQVTKHEPLPPHRVTDRTLIDVRSAAIPDPAPSGGPTGEGDRGEGAS